MQISVRVCLYYGLLLPIQKIINSKLLIWIAIEITVQWSEKVLEKV
jgi:hypothetical protein